MRFMTRAQYVEWLAQYRWQMICVFTLRPGRSTKTAKRLLKQWFEDMQEAEGRQLSWVVRLERSATGQPHFHVLIAGISTRVYAHAKQWQKMAGHAHIVKFKRVAQGRSGGQCRTEDRGVDYVLKGLRDDDYDIELALCDQHLLPRFRRVREPQIQGSALGGAKDHPSSAAGVGCHAPAGEIQVPSVTRSHGRSSGSTSGKLARRRGNV